MFNVIKVLIDHLCQLVLIKTERVGFYKPQESYVNSLHIKVVGWPGEGRPRSCGPLRSPLCWSVTAIFPTVIFRATVGFGSWQGSANRLCQSAARHGYAPSRGGTGSGQATPHRGGPRGSGWSSAADTAGRARWGCALSHWRPG